MIYFKRRIYIYRRFNNLLNGIFILNSKNRIYLNLYNSQNTLFLGVFSVFFRKKFLYFCHVEALSLNLNVIL